MISLLSVYENSNDFTTNFEIRCRCLSLKQGLMNRCVCVPAQNNNPGRGTAPWFFLELRITYESPRCGRKVDLHLFPFELLFERSPSFSSSLPSTQQKMVVHNPNNWHWVNKNCLPWANDYFNERLPSLDFSEHEVSISTITLTGDCDVSNRKGKVICIFDMSLDIPVSGKNAEEDFSGNLVVKDFMHDEQEYEYEFKGFGSHNEFIKSVVLPQVKKQLWAFQDELLKAQEADLQKNNVAHP